MDIQAVRLFLEEADKMAPLDQCLEEAGFSKRSRKLVSRLRSSVRCAERSLTVAARIRAARVSKRVLAKRTYSDGLDTSDMRLLFVRSRNRLRSATAETLFSTFPDACIVSRFRRRSSG